MRKAALFFVGTLSFLAACSTRRVNQLHSDGGSGDPADAASTLCTPNARDCDGITPRQCAPDGESWIAGQACDAEAGQYCGSGYCVDLCANAASNNSYVGCEYYAVPTANSLISHEFDFAIVVTNPNSSPARVTITQGSAQIGQYTIASSEVRAIPLPWVPELSALDPETFATQSSSVLLRDKAYRVVSNIPVTAYQFNPLDYRLDDDCEFETSGMEFDGQCFSFSNDASLLLPVHSLTGNYTVISYGGQLLQSLTFGSPDGGGGPTPAFMTVVGAQDGVQVEIEFTADVSASSDGTTVRAFRAGQTGSFSLDAGDVLQIQTLGTSTCASGSPVDEIDAFSGYRYCTPPRAADLSGTRVRATGKVEVIGGHVCAFVPYNRWACDHLEETMLPEDTWGRDFIVSITKPLREEPNVVRIVSSEDGNALTFDPPVRGNTTLNRGDVLEFEATESFRVRGSKALIVAQLLVGQDYAGLNTSGELFAAEGDPSLSLAVPQEQYRTRYDFLAPESYASNFVNIVAPNDVPVRLDGTVVGGFTPVGVSGFSVARVEISGGAHVVESGQPIGIVVYGFGSYTSYMYPGGLNLEVINLL